jgi:TRAP-type C4-dicarboxylate transport system permease small subunit
MRRTLDTFYGGLTALAALALLAAFACVMLGIVDRQVNWGLRGLDAYAGYCIASALFLALPGTLQAGEHIRVTLLLQRLPAAWRHAMEWWSLGAGLVLAAMLAGYACKLVWVSHSTHDISQGADATPLWLPQIGMALGCIGLLVALADAAWAHATGRTFFRQTGEAARSE